MGGIHDIPFHIYAIYLKCRNELNRHIILIVYDVRHPWMIHINSCHYVCVCVGGRIATNHTWNATELASMATRERHTHSVRFGGNIAYIPIYVMTYIPEAGRIIFVRCYAASRINHCVIYKDTEPDSPVTYSTKTRSLTVPWHIQAKGQVFNAAGVSRSHSWLKMRRQTDRRKVPWCGTILAGPSLQWRFFPQLCYSGGPPGLAWHQPELHAIAVVIDAQRWGAQRWTFSARFQKKYSWVQMLKKVSL